MSIDAHINYVSLRTMSQLALLGRIVFLGRSA
jgi:hypothetical protein